MDHHAAGSLQGNTGATVLSVDGGPFHEFIHGAHQSWERDHACTLRVSAVIILLYYTHIILLPLMY